MKRIGMVVLFALAFMFGTMAAPASADHNVPEITYETTQCGETTFTADWTEGQTHLVGSARLVVDDGVTFQDIPIGESVTVGPFTTETHPIRYRVWGGGERNYDVPALSVSDLAALLVYLETDGNTPLDPEAPGINWLTLEVTGCVPPPATESPAPPTESPAPSTPEPTPSTEPSPSESAVPEDGQESPSANPVPAGLAVTPGAPWKTMLLLVIVAGLLSGAGYGLLRYTRTDPVR